MYIVVLTTLMMVIGFMWSAEALLPVAGCACAMRYARLTSRRFRTCGRLGDNRLSRTSNVNACITKPKISRRPIFREIVFYAPYYLRHRDHCGGASKMGIPEAFPVSVTAPPQTQPSLPSSIRRMYHQVPFVSLSKRPTTNARCPSKKKSRLP